jgi:hypothetical protein
MATIICDTCGGRGHMSYECPSARMFNRGLRRFWKVVKTINQDLFSRAPLVSWLNFMLFHLFLTNTGQFFLGVSALTMGDEVLWDVFWVLPFSFSYIRI